MNKSLIKTFPLALLLLLMMSSCNNKTKEKQKELSGTQSSMDLNWVQWEIEQDYFKVLTIIDEQKQSGLSPNLLEKNSNNLKLVIGHINSIGVFDYKSEQGLLILELIKQIVESYCYLEFMNAKNLSPLKQSLIDLNKRNNNEVASLEQIDSFFKKE